MHRISKISENLPPPQKKNNPDVLKNVASFEEDHGD